MLTLPRIVGRIGASSSCTAITHEESHLPDVGKHLPANNLRDLVALAKSKSDRLSYGSAGIGISNHLEGELFSNQIATELVHVPYKGGSSEARQDLFAGRIDMLFDVVGNAVPFIKDGRLKAIGVAQGKRTKLAPDLPTLAESGLPEFDVMPWTGVFGPANVDAAVVDKISGALLDALKDDKIVARLATLGIEAIGYGPEDEMQLAGLEAAPSTMVRPPRVAASPAALECRVISIQELKDIHGIATDWHLVMGEIVGVHIDPRFLEDGLFDTAKARVLARCGYRGYYSATEELLEIARPAEASAISIR